MITRGNLCLAATVVAFVVVAPAAPAPDADDLEFTQLCPPVQDLREVVTIDGVEVRAPASAEDHTATMSMLASDDRDQRLRAAISLGLAGHVAAFHRILESRDLAILKKTVRFRHGNRAAPTGVFGWERTGFSEKYGPDWKDRCESWGDVLTFSRYPRYLG